MKTISLICPVCQQKFDKSLAHYKSNIKRGRQNVCSSSCASSLATIKSLGSNIVICKTCNKEFKKKVSEIKKSKSGNHFCSRSCSQTYNNTKRIKKVKVKPKIKKLLFLNKTKKELFDTSKDYFSARSTITKHARRIFNKSNQTHICKICGYDKHIQVAHIKAVSDFDDNALISDINSIDNLMPLCPNHHLEYDHDMLDI